MATITIEQLPSTSAAARAGRNFPTEEELKMGLIVAAAHVHATLQSEERAAPAAVHGRQNSGVISRKFAYFIFAVTVIVPFLKIIGSLTVLFIDVEIDHICKMSECRKLVYDSDSAIYFLVSLVFLVVSVFHLFLGLQIFTRYPDVRCLLVIDNVQIKAIYGPMKFFASVTAFETFVIVLAAFYSHPNVEMVFPCILILGIEICAFMSVLCSTTSSHPTLTYVGVQDETDLSDNDNDDTPPEQGSERMTVNNDTII